MRLSRSRVAWTVLCLLTGMVLMVSAGYIHAKAWLAQQLILRAWHESVASGKEVRPWPWADTNPVALLRYADQEWVVLAGGSGAVLAFGPGLMSGTSAPGTSGTSVIAAHRDTHFSILRDFGVGEELVITTPDNKEHKYRVETISIEDARNGGLTINRNMDELVLVTCYPFDAVSPGSPWRFVVRASIQQV